MSKAPNHQPMRERIAATVIVDDSGCWLWQKAKNKEGYGIINIRGRGARLAHRVAYETFIGPIPEGLQVDHECHNQDKSCQGGSGCAHRRCLNPEHLRTLTGRANVLRGRTIAAINAAVTHCPQEHKYTPENTRTYRGLRYCKACHRARERARYWRKKAEAVL